LIDNCNSGKIKAKIAAVISNNSKAYGLERAREAGIKAVHISKFKYPKQDEYVRQLLMVLEQGQTDLIVLAGYMKLLPPEITEKYYGRIINIHPALLPKFGGKGMYGQNVHIAVLEAGEKRSGATVHVVDSRYDQGPILIQRTVPVLPDDNSEALASRILQIEHEILTEAVALFIK